MTAVASANISIFSALNAIGHQDSQRARLERLTRQIRVVRAFTRGKSSSNSSSKPSSPSIIRTGSVVEVRQELKRRATEDQPLPLPIGKLPPTKTLWARLTSQPCFRGFAAYLTMQVPQWYLSQVIDLLLSGQPADHKLGYGSTAIVLATAFGGGFAVWTHYCITRPSNKRIFAHFPKGHEVLTELWPVTAFWAVCDHLPNSIPLALSRALGLRAVAFDALAWNNLNAQQRQVRVAEFAGVWLLHCMMVAVIALPATMILRRFYASMLSDEDLAIVPFHRGDGEKKRKHDYEARSRLQKPGLTVSEAWATVTWQQYLRVLAVYAGWVLLNQLVQMIYWWSNWELHKVLDVERFASTKLPCSPVGMITPAVQSNGTLWGYDWMKSEL